MIYVEYEKLKRQYEYMHGVCDQILREKEKFFVRTQPNAIRYDKLNVAGGKRENGFDDYLDNCEHFKVEERLNEAIHILQARAELLRFKEEQLRKSKEIDDIIYTMKFLDNAKPRTIAMALGYSESQIYRIIERIHKNIQYPKF